jgi:hypothetical protein
MVKDRVPGFVGLEGQAQSSRNLLFTRGNLPFVSIVQSQRQQKAQRRPHEDVRIVREQQGRDPNRQPVVLSRKLVEADCEGDSGCRQEGEHRQGGGVVGVIRRHEPRLFLVQFALARVLLVCDAWVALEKEKDAECS